MKRLRITLLVLLALAAASYALSFASLGEAGLFVALAVATLKIVGVAWSFMELGDSEQRVVRVVAILAPVFVLLLVGLAAADVLLR